MTTTVSFRCPSLLLNEVEQYAAKLGCNRTDAIHALIQRGLEFIHSPDSNDLVAFNRQINTVSKLTLQALCVINQLADLAGDEVLSDAEADYLAQLNQLGIKQ